ncbi:glutathione S-transferase omega-1-like [Ptychodera flava]|uniref:glutathione S-transferase omega-1-like n=1 Tax=Ptychodera flava TaxID=63121 RepID=UPI00396A9B63
MLRSISYRFGVRSLSAPQKFARRKHSVVSSATESPERDKMSERHLSKGSPLPPQKDGTIRLYSMRFCPYAQRSRMALAAKGIKFELVNCNLMKKPEWLLARNPKGLVPVLEHDGIVVFESLVVNDYLDEVFPGQRSLNPKDPLQRAKDGMVMDFFNSYILEPYFNFVRMRNDSDKTRSRLLKGLNKLNGELKNRGTKFFGGNQPGMLDYNMWPWFERLHQMRDDAGVVVFDDTVPILSAYIDRMFEDEAVKTTYNPPSLRRLFSQSYISGNPQYDFDETVQAKL